MLPLNAPVSQLALQLRSSEGYVQACCFPGDRDDKLTEEVIHGQDTIQCSRCSWG
jgi:hypothetical protein